MRKGACSDADMLVRHGLPVAQRSSLLMHGGLIARLCLVRK